MTCGNLLERATPRTQLRRLRPGIPGAPETNLHEHAPTVLCWNTIDSPLKRSLDGSTIDPALSLVSKSVGRANQSKQRKQNIHNAMLVAWVGQDLQPPEVHDRQNGSRERWQTPKAQVLPPSVPRVPHFEGELGSKLPYPSGTLYLDPSGRSAHVAAASALGTLDDERSRNALAEYILRSIGTETGRASPEATVPGAHAAVLGLAPLP